MKRLGLVVVLAAGPLVAACGAGTNLAVSHERPGTSVKVVNPNPSKWNNPVQPAGPRTANTRVYVCKPLACAGSAVVGIQTGPSPTRHPDRAALEKAAKLLPTQAKAQDLMMDAASEGDERQTSLSSTVTEARGYPAIIAEVKRTTRGKARYIVRGDLFIGSMLIKLVSLSSTREEAKRNFDEFVNIMEIADFEAPLPGAVRADTNAAPANDQPHPAFSSIR